MILTGYYTKSIIYFFIDNMLKCKLYTKLIELYFSITYPVKHINFFQQDRKCVLTFSKKETLAHFLLNDTLLFKYFLRKENEDYLMFWGFFHQGQQY